MNTGVATVLAIEWKDYGPFVQGGGAVLAALVGAVVAGYFALRNSKKTPYENLQALVKTREIWPPGLTGVDTVDRSIENALAEIRNVEVDVHPVAETDAELKADLRASARQAKRRWRAIVATFVGVSAWALANWVHSPIGLAVWTVTVVLGLTLLVVRVNQVFKRYGKQVAGLDPWSSDDRMPEQWFDY